MTKRDLIVACVCCVFVVGAGCRSKPKGPGIILRADAGPIPIPPIQLLSVKDLPANDPALAKLRSVPLCLYVFEKRSGNLLRMTLDGSKRELVLATRIKEEPKSRFGLADRDDPIRTQERLVHHWGLGHGEACTIDVVPRQERPLSGFPRRFSGDMSPERFTMYADRQIPFSDSAGPNPWLVHLDFIGRESYQQTFFDGPDFMTFIDDAGKRVRMDGKPQLQALISPGYALVVRDDKLILWDLTNDRRILICEVWAVQLWPRDLRQPERFKCRLSSGEIIDVHRHPVPVGEK